MDDEIQHPADDAPRAPLRGVISLTLDDPGGGAVPLTLTPITTSSRPPSLFATARVS
jgi:hypothetical protein